MKTLEAAGYIKGKWHEAILNEMHVYGETTFTVKIESVKTILSFLKQTGQFEVLMDLTGVDYLHPVKQTKVVYWLHNPSNLERLRIAIFAARDEEVPTVLDLWEGAEWYERELYDLFGVRFAGHFNIKRILMPDNWQGHPLRKDYALGEEPVEFKHGVKPKVPSEIISYVENENQKYSST